MAWAINTVYVKTNVLWEQGQRLYQFSGGGDLKIEFKSEYFSHHFILLLPTFDQKYLYYQWMNYSFRNGRFVQNVAILILGIYVSLLGMYAFKHEFIHDFLLTWN